MKVILSGTPTLHTLTVDVCGAAVGEESDHRHRIQH